MHQSLQGATFHLEHILPRSKSGTSSLDNLAWCCPSCNLHKSDTTTVPDPQTGEEVSLFHPRRMQWPDHFRWDGYRLLGLSPIGRATLQALQLNSDRRVHIRRAEARFNLFPPEQIQ